jgi:hypothetical protein
MTLLEKRQEHARRYLHPACRTEQVRGKISETNKKSPLVAKALKKALQKHKESPKCQAAETHASSKEISVRSPTGEVYHAVNAHHFVRTHKHLFSRDDTEERPSGNYSKTSRAAHGLSLLRPGLKSGYPIWKGWTWADRIKKPNNL